MLAKKKGFVLYFDSYPSIAQLSDEQRGALFSALYQYAQGICDCAEDPVDAVTKYPRLDPDARMAFCFMAGNIARDTEKWKQRQARCSEAAEARAAERREKKTETSDPAWMRPHTGRGKRDEAWDYV